MSLFKCPSCGGDLNSTPISMDYTDFVTRRGFRCELTRDSSCRWYGWVGVSAEEAEDGIYNDGHIQMGLNRLHEMRGNKKDSGLTGARLSTLLNALDRLAGEL